MTKVLAERTTNITTGVIDKAIKSHDSLRQVTFLDKNDTAHTVYAHQDGPFKTAEDIVRGWEEGLLHVFDSHHAAIEHWAAQEGAADFVRLLESVNQGSGSQQSQSGGGS